MTSPARTRKLLYFAWVREKIGCSNEELAIPASVETVGELLQWLKSKGGQYAHALEHEQLIRVALDQTHATPETRLENAREIALFPPVTGG